MRRLVLFLINLLILVFLVIGNIALSLVLPYPFSKVSLFLAGLIIWLLWSAKGNIVWFAFFASFIIELYSAIPFGIILFSNTVAMLFGLWLYRQIFTNRSWHAALAISAIILGFYRLFYILGLLTLKIFNFDIIIPWQTLLLTIFWEMFFTTLLVSLIYFFLSRFSRRLRPGVIEARYFRI